LKLDHALLALAILGHAGEIVPLHSAPFSPFISIMRIAILHGMHSRIASSRAGSGP